MTAGRFGGGDRLDFHALLGSTQLDRVGCDNPHGIEWLLAERAISWIEQIAAELGRTAWPGGESAWGKNRVWLHPKPGTQTYGRSGFSIHGGDTPGSAGCIDLTTSMPDFAREFLKCGKDLELTVAY